jgi:plastocyanin
MTRGFATTLGGIVSGLVVCVAYVGACSNDNGTPPAERDGGGRPLPESDGSIVIDASMPTTDAGPPLNGCTTYVDHTADKEVDLQWDFGIAQRPDHCSQIKVGSVVKWTGDFGTHPLDALGGDTPNPIAGAFMDAGGTGTTSIFIAFPNAGKFGYHCDVHATMLGAIEVVQ